MRRTTPDSSKLEQAMTLLSRKIKTSTTSICRVIDSLLQSGMEAKSANEFKKTLG